MPTSTLRRQLLAAAAATALPTRLLAANPAKPFRIYAITFRGMTDVEKGFTDYLTSRKVPFQMIYRDLNRDAARLPALLAEIRATRPDLVYTWGTSVTLGVVGPYDAPDPSLYINDIPVLFTLVAAPTTAKIVRDVKAPRRNVSGVTHVVPTEAQVRAIEQYRPFKTIGVLYTPTEKNSVAIVEEMNRIGAARGFRCVARTFQLNSAGKPVADGAAEMVRELKEAGAEWLYLSPDSFLGTLAEGTIIPAAMQLGLPTFASTEQLMQAGALVGLVSRYYNVGQFTAHKAEQLLVERLPVSSVPIETLSRFSYQIRLPAAHRLNLLPPLSMLSYAELISGDTATQ